MPRGFTPQEMEIIREKLINAGQACVERFGIRKTTVEDITRMAGISKGAFYKFFDSKEILIFTVFERIEAQYRLEMKEVVLKNDGLAPKDQVRNLISEAFTQYRKHPLYSILNLKEYESMVSKLPPEVVQDHVQDDDVFAAELITMWEKQGVMIKCSAEEVAALIKALFFVSFHDQEIGSAFPGTFETLVNLVSSHFVDG